MGATDTRYVFRGSAVGAAGHIHYPDDLIIWVQGASALPVIGGYSRSKLGSAKFSDVLSLDSVRTEASGDFSEKENAYKTLANSVVKGVNVNGRLTADALQATLTSTHPASGGEPAIIPTGTEIVNIRLDGYPVIVTLDLATFTNYSTRESLSRAYTHDHAFYKQHGHRFLSPDTDKKKRIFGKRQIPVTGGYIVSSIVSKIETNHPKAVVDGHIITLNGFGSIFLGEILITDISRRLTLLRVKLGSPIRGAIACAEVEGNGSIIF
jgi:hypothetical protein